MKPYPNKLKGRCRFTGRLTGRLRGVGKSRFVFFFLWLGEGKLVILVDISTGKMGTMMYTHFSCDDILWIDVANLSRNSQMQWKHF